MYLKRRNPAKFLKNTSITAISPIKTRFCHWPKSDSMFHLFQLELLYIKDNKELSLKRQTKKLCIFNILKKKDVTPLHARILRELSIKIILHRGYKPTSWESLTKELLSKTPELDTKTC